MSLLFGVHAASFVDCDDAVLWSSCWERLNKNARTCGTGAIVSVGECSLECSRPQPGHNRPRVQVCGAEPQDSACLECSFVYAVKDDGTADLERAITISWIFSTE